MVDNYWDKLILSATPLNKFVSSALKLKKPKLEMNGGGNGNSNMGNGRGNWGDGGGNGNNGQGPMYIGFSAAGAS